MSQLPEDNSDVGIKREGLAEAAPCLDADFVSCCECNMFDSIPAEEISPTMGARLYRSISRPLQNKTL
ncbi:Hypothetical predicted protein [Lynx pardinus]|uniref:Uncharacterized protein n=1 Tax=Lynx pardinus TaxID=191816 RepID=A0A485NV07_LYNPA|nr:Hypothetical predicted protein [Lynx pardinus]